MYRLRNNSLAVLFIAILSASILACGPGFPNSYLTSGDEMLIRSPRFSFTDEINNIEIDHTVVFNAIYPTNRYHSRQEHTLKLDIQELSEALTKDGYSLEMIEQILSKYQHIRQAIQNNSGTCIDLVRQIPEDIPEEFRLYLQGAIYYKSGEQDKAVIVWKRILELPPALRLNRSTWAAYMLGKCNSHTPTIALEWYQTVRQLVQEGFQDSQSLAASSYGQEAAIYLNQGKLHKAIELYMIQSQTGDRFAIPSLRFVSRDIYKNCNLEHLTELVKNPLTRMVLMAYAISSTPLQWRQDTYTRDKKKTHPMRPQQSLLIAIENAELSSVQHADRMAFIAYQAGEFEKAHRWLAIANVNSILTRRVRAKLYLREGKVKEGIEDLAFVAHQTEPGKLIAWSEGDWRDTPYKLHSELGSLYITQAMYIQALDIFMKGGNWIDAAYIAERVLTPEELKYYVDNNWPSRFNNSEPKQMINDRGWYSVGEKAVEIRYLLARRLTRLQQYEEARSYFPQEYLEDFNKYVSSLGIGVNTTLSDNERADALWTAAWLARHRGMELMGTELDPDWHIYSGNNGQVQRLSLRQDARKESKINVPSQDEIDRAKKHTTLPQERFHYRYIASELARDATELMPDQNDETARRLCLAGIWHRDRDNQYADIFYKSLVNRCGKTDLGKEADRIRWFPKIKDTLEADTFSEL